MDIFKTCIQNVSKARECLHNDATINNAILINTIFDACMSCSKNGNTVVLFSTYEFDNIVQSCNYSIISIAEVLEDEGFNVSYNGDAEELITEWKVKEE